MRYFTIDDFTALIPVRFELNSNRTDEFGKSNILSSSIVKSKVLSLQPVSRIRLVGALAN
ncbi:hypothetical protein DSM107010_19720 [Chroococcidiopsis cubana SAG 39.79]|uniref:Uncharacterized protein n=1 Tax=Chroococcidiopsis cubana SAG 39.79 TaxID=388085 RepID=A0AB37UN57_9CYAN|nr:hypothetical protein DSM107010_19720 [Chroococcidiopsis cubana SAG 39.79]